MGKHIWGYWDCSYCGSKHIRGDNKGCPNCGIARDADTHFYLDDKAPREYVSEKDKNSNPDWICGYCGSANSSFMSKCTQCGADKKDNDGDYFNKHQKRNIVEQVKTEQDISDISTRVTNNVGASFIEKIKGIMLNTKYKHKIFKGVILTLSIILVTIFCIWLFTPIERQMYIDSFEWQRNIEVQELRTFNESDWSLPSSARLQYTKSEIQCYEDVIDHYETKTRQVEHEKIVGYEERVVGYRDLGNGQFEEQTVKEPKYETYYETEVYTEPIYRQEPVYATKYYYEIDKWVHDYDIPTSGVDKAPYWGTVTLGVKERQGVKSESYYVVGIIDNKQRKCKIGYSDWERLNQKDTIKFITFRFNYDIIDIIGLNECTVQE